MATAQTSAATGAAASEKTVMVSSTACLVGEAGAPMSRAGTKAKRTSSDGEDRPDDQDARGLAAGAATARGTLHRTGSAERQVLVADQVGAHPTVNVPDM